MEINTNAIDWHEIACNEPVQELLSTAAALVNSESSDGDEYDSEMLSVPVTTTVALNKLDQLQLLACQQNDTGLVQLTAEITSKLGTMKLTVAKQKSQIYVDKNFLFILRYVLFR